jgi:superfamily II DNA or RNA helicase
MTNEEIEKFFHETTVLVYSNAALREPQIGGYQAIHEYFDDSNEPCYVQLPVGSGKTGLMGITPFGLASGRVLILTPNVTIRDTVRRELDISRPDCFYLKRGVFVPSKGPFISELKPGANFHDCENAHIVLANIQQFSGANNKWYEKFPNDYFRLILVDEGHHNVAETWRRLFDHFSDARVVSYTATPLRSDGQKIAGKRVYNFTYTRSMLMGFISPIDAVYVSPQSLTFTAEGRTRTYTLEEVLQMRERDWFSRGIAASEVCNRGIVQASVKKLADVRALGGPRQIIAAACSIRHATQVAALYHEHGLTAEVLHSDLDEDTKKLTKARLESGAIDAVVQVQMLGEGFDLGTLSVAAVFRPYRSLSPYIQFVGRILRLANPANPSSPGNHVYLVSHVGLNDERWWTDFTNFDREDQQFVSEYLTGTSEVIDEAGGPRLTLRPFMRVLNETIDKYVQRGFLTEVNQQMVLDILDTIREKGFDPLEFGLTEDMMMRRLEMTAAASREVAPFRAPVQPQRQKEALRMRVQQDARAIADTVVNRFGLKHGGKDLIRVLGKRGGGNTNVSMLIAMALGSQNKKMGVDSGGRDDASIEQFQAALNAAPDIVDELTALVKAKIRQGTKEGDEGA